MTGVCVEEHCVGVEGVREWSVCGECEGVEGVREWSVCGRCEGVECIFICQGGSDHHTLMQEL